jgi:hypothetical protein
MLRPRALLLLLASAAAWALMAPAPARAVSGVVTDTEGKPVVEARVCHFQPETGLEQLCVATDEQGRFEIIDTEYMSVRVSLPGYFPETVEAQGHHEIVLEQSPTLTVRLVEASTRQPIDSGEVFVVYPSASKKGPFPTNQAGVRIARVLQPGEVRLIGRAEGYEDSEPLLVKLERAKHSEATLELRRRADADQPGAQ